MIYLSKTSVYQALLYGYLCLVCACKQGSGDNRARPTAIEPLVITDAVEKDSDDPAIWVNQNAQEESLILGTDKAGILFAFDLQGAIVKKVREVGMKRLNNVDVEYGMMIGGKDTDIAVATDRDAKKLYVFRLPDLTRLAVVDAFKGEAERRAMGIGLYKRPRDGHIFAIVSRKGGPSGSYLWQYLLREKEDGGLELKKVRTFGRFSGVNEDGEGEIEAVVVDDELGYVYYCDELYGIRKYHADPDRPDSNEELAVFGTEDFEGDREGIAIYRLNAGRGYILVSDQQANVFRVFSREGTDDDPHKHRLVKVLNLSTNKSDGCEITGTDLSKRFPGGLFVAMSNDKTFHFYSLSDIFTPESLAPSSALMLKL
ncbi:phytase [bacterium]|nr:phytase [bacterium]